MSKDRDASVNQAINTPTSGQQQVQIQIDDAQTDVHYSTTSRVWGSAEEVYLDFAGGIRPAGAGKAVMRVEQRIILSPWSAKRLAIALNQVVANHEKQFGPLELDVRKRSAAAEEASG